MYEEIDKFNEYAEEIFRNEDVLKTEIKPMWCTDCKRIVDAELQHDYTVGVSWWECPCNNTHYVEELNYCCCGELKGESEDYCDDCKTSLFEALRRFNGALPYGMDKHDALEYVLENWT